MLMQNKIPNKEKIKKFSHPSKKDHATLRTNVPVLVSLGNTAFPVGRKKNMPTLNRSNPKGMNRMVTQQIAPSTKERRAIQIPPNRYHAIVLRTFMMPKFMPWYSFTHPFLRACLAFRVEY